MEITEVSLGTKVQPLWHLLPEEDVTNSTKWFPLQICPATSAGFGISSDFARRAWAPCPQVLLQAARHSHTPPHTHPRTCSFTHALTLRSIFKLIALSALDFLTLISKSYICLSDIRHAWALFDLIHGSSLESPSVSNPMHQSAWPEPLDWPWCLAGLTPLHTQLGFH